MPTERQLYADAYRALLEQVQISYGCAEADDELPLPGELEVQALWHGGLLGHEGQTLRHGVVRILDFGEWNRGAGPDFQRAEIEINGARMRGDIEIDPCAQDWEHHGHGANLAYTNVVLHVVLSPPPAGWYTRNAEHRDIPVLPIPPQVIRTAMGLGTPPPRDCGGLCREPLADKSAAQVELLLRSAAAYRAQNKRKVFIRKADVLGESQAWFEAFAETLGYKINKVPMQLLARRAPLAALRRADAEGLLLGTAGFLVPVLPAKADIDARTYHRRVWDAWWPLRERYQLAEERALPWRYAPLRPANHPHRRVAALSIIASRWHDIEPLLHAESARELSRLLTGLQHPYWSHRCSLPSAKLSKSVALIGEERVKDFLVNHLYVQDEAPFAWSTYLSLKNSDIPQRVQLTARRLFGEREDIRPLLRYMYIQQALLQIDTDFCALHPCRDCYFPEQLNSWCML